MPDSPKVVRKEKESLADTLAELANQKHLSSDVATHANTVRINTNHGSHYKHKAPPTDAHVRVALIALLEVLIWYYENYVVVEQSSSTTRKRSRRKPVRKRPLKG